MNNPSKVPSENLSELYKDMDDNNINSDYKRSIKEPINKSKGGETIITGTLNRLGNAVIYSAAYKYSIIQIDNNLITNVIADHYVVSFLDVGSSYTFKFYKFFPVLRKKILFSIENENGKFKIRKRILLNILMQYNTLFFFVGFLTILMGAVFFSFMFETGTSIILACIVHLMQVIYTNYKIISSYIKS